MNSNYLQMLGTPSQQDDLIGGDLSSPMLNHKPPGSTSLHYIPNAATSSSNYINSRSKRPTTKMHSKPVVNNFVESHRPIQRKSSLGSSKKGINNSASKQSAGSIFTNKRNSAIVPGEGACIDFIEKIGLSNSAQKKKPDSEFIQKFIRSNKTDIPNATSISQSMPYFNFDQFQNRKIYSL